MSDFLELTNEPLSLDKINDLVSSPECGAISIFIGNYFKKSYYKALS